MAKQTTKKPENWRQFLLATADYIEKNGFIKGRLGRYEEDGYAVCSIGGMQAVNYRHHVMPIFQEAHKSYNDYLRDTGKVRTPSVSPTVTYNDNIDRKKAEVLAAMRDCARTYKCPDQVKQKAKGERPKKGKRNG